MATGAQGDQDPATRWSRVKELAGKGAQAEPADREEGEPEFEEPVDSERAPDAQLRRGKAGYRVPVPGYIGRWASPFVRFLVFNGSAAALGSAIGLGSFFGQFTAAAGTAANGLLQLAGTVGAGWAVWKVIRHVTVGEILPGGVLGLIVRFGLVFAAAEVGRRLAPLILPTAISYGAHYTGLTPGQVELLITGIALCGPTGYLVWRYRQRHLPLRWLSRVPLATAVLTCALS